jgi:hypothetical protein
MKNADWILYNGVVHTLTGQRRRDPRSPWPDGKILAFGE